MSRLRTSLAFLAALAATPGWAQTHAGHAGMDHAQHGDHAQHRAGAASMLTASVPTDGAKLRAAPRTFRLTFAHPVVIESAVLVDGRGKRSALRVPTASGATQSIALPSLGKGAYVIEWRTGGGHVMQGRSRFSVN